MAMRKVHIVSKGVYDDWTICAVLSSKKKASEYAEKVRESEKALCRKRRIMRSYRDTVEIEEWPLNPLG